jgi:hypothetical protein
VQQQHDDRPVARRGVLSGADEIALLVLVQCARRGLREALTRHHGGPEADEMINGQKRRPIVEFIEADDFENSGAVVATLKGKGNGCRSMFAPGDELPAGYEELTIEIFRDRVSGPQAYNRLAVVAEAGNLQTMCTHALLQLGLRS